MNAPLNFWATNALTDQPLRAFITVSASCRYQATLITVSASCRYQATLILGGGGGTTADFRVESWLAGTDDVTIK